MENVIWFLGAYAAGTGIGWYMHSNVSRYKDLLNIANVTVDTLIKDGYLRHRTNEEGEIELLKIDD